jgi:hypothetical protein
MNASRCLKIATRIGTLLEHELGLGVDARRMLTERLYLRDVLLVCEAHRGSLAELAAWFRRSAAESAAGSTGDGVAGSLAGGPADGAVHAAFDPATHASAAASGFGLDSGFGYSARRSSSPPSATWSPAP